MKNSPEKQIKTPAENKSEFTWTQYFIGTVTLAVLSGVTFWNIVRKYPDVNNIPEPYKTAASIFGLLFLISIIAVLGGLIVAVIQNYLVGNFQQLKDEKLSLPPLQTKDLISIKSEIAQIREVYTEFLNKSSSSEKLDVNELIESIRIQALSELPDKITKSLENKFASKSVDNSQILLIRQQLSVTKERFEKEIFASGRRSNLNLIIGIMVTIVGAGLLAYISFENKPDFGTNITALLAHYLPRITTIIFIEVFAFFFLRLYKSGLQEIKYFQNELTNIVLQQIAIEAAMIQRHNKPLEGIIEQLVKTERNSIKQLNPKVDENSLSVKDVNSFLETLSKVTGKGK